MRIALRIGRYLLRTLLGIVAFIALYFLVMFVLTWIPSNRGFVEPEEGVDIFVYTNGVHADVVVPVKNDVCDWSKKLPYTHAAQADANSRYLSIGWGDKGFYINTPTWADLKASTAFNAAFWLSTSAMHVTWRKYAPREDETCRRVRISAQQYRRLCAYIMATFDHDANGKAIYIEAKTYGKHDAFYEARGRYNLFKTCNVWTGNALRYAGVKVSVWTPFDKCVFYHLPGH